ncbi:MAG: hypothetical protein V1735_05005 [Nanoarchaeota archaeon]
MRYLAIAVLLLLASCGKAGMLAATDRPSGFEDLLTQRLVERGASHDSELDAIAASIASNVAGQGTEAELGDLSLDQIEVQNIGLGSSLDAKDLDSALSRIPVQGSFGLSVKCGTECVAIVVQHKL